MSDHPIDAEKLHDAWFGGNRGKSDAEAGRDMAAISSAERLARAVLMFFESGDWSNDKRELWLAITGKDDATSRTLGDLARQVRDEEERK